MGANQSTKGSEHSLGVREVPSSPPPALDRTAPLIFYSISELSLIFNVCSSLFTFGAVGRERGWLRFYFYPLVEKDQPLHIFCMESRKLFFKSMVLTSRWVWLSHSHLFHCVSMWHAQTGFPTCADSEEGVCSDAIPEGFALAPFCLYGRVFHVLMCHLQSSHHWLAFVILSIPLIFTC